jgi:hypothetical protein
VPTYHDGGIAGQVTSPRYIHPAYFDDAPRYHSGGIAGLMPDEVPAILRRGEPVFRDLNHARSVAGGGTTVNVTINQDFKGHIPTEEVGAIAEAAANHGCERDRRDRGKGEPTCGCALAVRAVERCCRATILYPKTQGAPDSDCSHRRQAKK